MDSKILILSHPKLTAVVQQVITGMEQLPEVTIRDVGFGEIVHFLNENLLAIQPNIIITGGAHWEMLNQSNYSTSIPIVPIPVTQFDLLQAALQARQFGEKIAVIHYGDELKEGKEILKDLDCEFHFIRYRTKEDAVSAIASLKASGIDAIIGAGMVCAISDTFHIPSVFIHSKDSVIKIMEHVARLETARLDIASTAQKWSMEFMKNPVLTYEIESYSHNPILSSAQTPLTLQTNNKKWSILEEFLFHKTISSFFTDRVKPFFNHDYPYVSLGIIQLGQVGVDAFWTKFKAELDAIVYVSTKGDQCRFLLLTKNHFSSSFLNNKLKADSGKVIGGLSSALHYDDLFSSDNQLMNKLFEAEVAFELAHIAIFSEPILLFDPANPFTLLFHLARRDDLPETTLLQPLFGHRNTNKLLTTLRLLLDHGLSITAVANHLGSSRQTVYASLKRIESLIGLLTDPETRFSLSLELRILEITKAVAAVNKRKMQISPYHASAK